MRPERRDLEPFAVVGIETRTSNAREALPGRSKIGALWGRLASEVLAALGTTGEPHQVVSAYTAYESDHTGEYTVVLGVRAAPGTSAPAPLKVLHVPAGRYLVFTGSGPQPGATVDTWGRVWEYFSGSPDAARAYTTDFEVHRGETVEIYVALAE